MPDTTPPNPASDHRHVAPVSDTTTHVWLLKHTWGEPGQLTRSEKAYVDPAIAIRDLAREIRPRWELARTIRATLRSKLRDLPPEPPANNYAAVAMYFWEPPKAASPWRETYELWRVQPNSAKQADINREVAEPAAGPEYVLVQMYGEVLCICGNRADIHGFEYTDRDGQITGPSGDCDWLFCWHCRRLFDALTGEVVNRLPAHPNHD